MQNQHHKNMFDRPASRKARRLTLYSCLLLPVSCLLPPASCLLPLCLLITLTGCATLKVPQIDTSFLKPPGPVTSVIASWTPAISNGENSERGFGGRVYFHDQDMRPVKIKGTVIVYVYEEDGRKPCDPKPDEGVVFDEKTLNSKGVYAKTSLGHSYNLWVPIDADGHEGQAKKVSLLVRYVPNQGTPQFSSLATTHLPGRRGGQEVPVAEPDWQVREKTEVVHQAWADPFSSNQAEPVQHRRSPEHRTLSDSDRPQAMQAVTIR